MPKIKLDKLKVGQIVARDVRNMDDMLLLPAGCVLTERHIDILQTWGIPEVDVEASTEPEDNTDPLSKLPPEVVAQLTAEQQARFWNFDQNNQVQAEVLKTILRRLARMMLDKEKQPAG